MWKVKFLVGSLLVISLLVILPQAVRADTASLDPNDSGTYSEWTYIGGNQDYTNLKSDDVDNSYAKATKKGQTLTVNVDDSDLTGSINSVKVYAKAKLATNPETVDDAMKIVVRTHDSDNSSRAFRLTENYKVYSETWENNPATSQPWTWDEINEMEIGLKSVKHGPQFENIHSTRIWAVVDLPPFDFGVDVSASSLKVERSSSTSTTVSVDLLQGTTEMVALSGEWVDTAPGGVTPSFNPSSGEPSFDSTLTFDTKANSTTGTFKYRVKATDGGREHTTEVTLKITEEFDFSISASPDNLMLSRSGERKSTLSVDLITGIARTVSLEGSLIGTSPEGITSNLSPDSGTPPFESITTFSTSQDASQGEFTFRVTGQGGGLTRTADIEVVVNPKLSLSFSTDKDNYEKGETIEFSGTVDNPHGDPVSSGSVTIRFSSGDWTWENTMQFSEGAFRDNLQISFGYPDGTWNITVTAEDGSGNSGTVTENILVTTPPAYAYFTVQIQSPVAGVTYDRGEEVDFSVKVKEGDDAVENAEVSVEKPNGGWIHLDETVPGTYVGQYTLRMDDPIGKWSISVEGRKSVENSFKAGGVFLNVQVAPANLQIDFLKPIKRKLETGRTIEIKVKATYPNGDPVEDGIVMIGSPRGDNIPLTSEGLGVYGVNYTLGAEDRGIWTLKASASDIYGNSGIKTQVIDVVEPSTVSMLARLWYVVFPVIIVTITVPSYLYLRRRQRQMLIGEYEKVQRKLGELPKLKEETARKYYRDGLISRGTYEKQMVDYEDRISELEEKEKDLKQELEAE